MDLDPKAPDHTTLSRRNQIAELPPLTRAHDGPIHLIVDSTGLKILRSGEWNAQVQGIEETAGLADASGTLVGTGGQGFYKTLE